MSLLRIFTKGNLKKFAEFDHHDEIKEALGKVNIEFQRWDELSMRTDQENLTDKEILNLYQEEIETINDLYGFQSVDIINVKPDFSKSEQFSSMRKKFLDEHTHADDEVRYFIDGSGLFYIHKDDQVYGLLCTAGDFISVPAKTEHWFDMGSQPDFKCIRFFTEESGWIPQYVEKSLSPAFPLLDEFSKVTV